MSALDTDLLTIEETAALLKVDRSTVRRWIDQERLPAYRVGGRSVRLRRGDLNRVIEPIKKMDMLRSPTMEPLLTPEQRREGLDAVKRARRRNEAVLAERKGVPYPPSWELLTELRDERSRDQS